MPSRTLAPSALSPAMAFAPTATTAATSNTLRTGQVQPTAVPTAPTASRRGSVPSTNPMVAAAAFGPTATGSVTNQPLGNYSIAPLPTPPPLQTPGNNMTNPGYTEQGLEYVQNRLLEDPASGQMQTQYGQTQSPSAGEQYLNQNLGSLNGPGSGEQYWNQVQGQFQDPFAGEQFARQQAQAMSPTGPAGAFFDQAMGQYDQFTGYAGPQNTQGQYAQSSSQLAGGTQGERGLAGIAGQYDQIGQYSGPNNAAGQYQQNAASGPLAGQQFYDQVGGSYDTQGRYTDPNLAAGQYAQTQQAFGDLPIANFDPFYDRASQLATQNYNRQAAGRGVYGSSEALSGVGNVITDIEAQRANRSFDAEMQRAAELRARQGLLGEQARMGDLSSLAAFGANMAGLETYGNLANMAGNQTLGQQTMLGNQARAADVSATDAFNANLQGAQTFGNLNEAQGRLELDRNQLLGSMANAADSQALGAQQANLAGVSAFGNLAGQADSAETNRFTATTNAMNQADRTALDRMGLGADIAFRGDAERRADFQAESAAASDAARLGLDRTRLGADIASQGSAQDLARLNSFMNAAGLAEGHRQARQNTAIDAMSDFSQDVQTAVSTGLEIARSGDQAAWEDYVNTTLAPYLQDAGYEQQEIDNIRQNINLGVEVIGTIGGLIAGGKK